MSVYHHTVWVKPWCENINSASTQDRVNNLNHLSESIDLAISLALNKIEQAHKTKIELVSTYFQPVMHAEYQCYLVTVIAKDIELPQAMFCSSWVDNVAIPGVN